MGLNPTRVRFSIRWDRVGLRRSPNLLLLGFAGSLIEGIPGAAHAEDRITLATVRQRFAKASYVDINRSIGDVDGWPPNALQKMLPRKDAPRPLEQTFEQPEFRWSEMDLAQAPADPSGLVVELNIASGGLREGATPYSIKTQCFRFAVSADWQPTKSPVFGRNAQIAVIA